MKYWLHRISHHAETSYPLLEQEYLSIGFSDFSNTEFINKTRQEGWEFFENSIQECWKSKPRTRHNLWRFIVEMKKGDRVLIPSWGDFSLYEIIDDLPVPIGNVDISNLKTWSNEEIIKKDDLLYKKDSDQLIDLGFVRKVKLINKDISRYEYADSVLTKRMKIRSTNADISDLVENVQNALNAFKIKQPISIHSKILEETRNNVLAIIKKELNPDKFESLIKWYFQKIGASEVYIPPKNEREKQGDADVVAVFETIKIVIYVQAKFHDGETSVWATRQINEYKNNKESMDDGYSKIAWVVSTADNFSQECKDLAKEHHVLLFNGDNFTTLILEAGIGDLNNL